MKAELDIVIPVYNEGANIAASLASLASKVKTPFRVLICYDRDDDDTLPALSVFRGGAMEIVLVKNRGRGPHSAVISGFSASSAPLVLVFPADDDYNAAIVDQMVALSRSGCEIVCASRFIKGGLMVGCPWLKAVLVRWSAFALRHAARVPSHDSSNGFRLFTRRVLDSIEIESDAGFIYSIELLVKCHRLRWKIGEVPSEWRERARGTSRFQVLTWLPKYFQWFSYAFATTYLLRSPQTVALKSPPAAAPVLLP